MFLTDATKVDIATRLTQNINQVADFDQALSMTLNQICQVTGWNYGEAWIGERDGTFLALSSAWGVGVQDSTDLFAWEQFRNCSEGLIVYPAEGLPGRVWLSQQPEWISDASSKSESYFLRNQISKGFGVKAGLGIPILLNFQMQLVLVFFMSSSRLCC